MRHLIVVAIAVFLLVAAVMQLKPPQIIKETVPVIKEVVKEVIVPQPVYVDKVVYRDKPVYRDRIVYQERG